MQVVEVRDLSTGQRIGEAVGNQVLVKFRKDAAPSEVQSACI